MDRLRPPAGSPPASAFWPAVLLVLT